VSDQPEPQNHDASATGVDQEALDKDIDRLIDVNKHLATLSAGALVLISTFLEKLFPENLWVLLKVSVAFGFLLLVVAMFYSTGNLANLTSSGTGSAEPRLTEARASTKRAFQLFALGLVLFAWPAYFSSFKLFS